MVSTVLPTSTNQRIFGGSSSSQSSNPVDTTPGELAGLRKPFASVVRRLLGGPIAGSGPLGGIPEYEGEFAAPITQAEQDFLAQLRELGGGVGSATLAKTASGGFVPENGELDPFTSAAISAAIAPFQRQQEEFLRRTLPSAQLEVGQTFGPGASSAASRFGAVESADIAGRAAEVAADIANEQFQAERGRQQEAIQLGQQEIETTIANFQAQALPRLIEQYGIDQGVAEFRGRIDALLQALAVVTGAPLVTQGQESRGESTAYRGEANTEVAKGLAQGAGSAFAASDARLKEDIDLLYQRADGIGIYSFRFKGDRRKQVGVLAQEVEGVRPDAVKTIDGVLYVHYDRLGGGDARN